MLTRCYEIDGFGVSLEMANARDFKHADLMEQTRNQERRYELEALQRAGEYGVSGNARNLSEVVLEMIEQGNMRRLMWNESLILDMDVWEAVNTACIILGLDDEMYPANLHKMGDQTEIQLQ